MTFQLKLSDKKAKEEIEIPTTALFQEYVRVLSTKPDDCVYSLCTLTDGSFHSIVEKLSAEKLIDELICEFLSSEDKRLPLYYLKLHLTETDYIQPLIPQDKYNELSALNASR